MNRHATSSSRPEQMKLNGWYCPDGYRSPLTGAQYTRTLRDVRIGRYEKSRHCLIQGDTDEADDGHLLMGVVRLRERILGIQDTGEHSGQLYKNVFVCLYRTGTHVKTSSQKVADGPFEVFLLEKVL